MGLTMTTFPGPCQGGCGATNYPISSCGPTDCDECARKRDHERKQAELKAWSHWQRPPGAHPREDKPAADDDLAGTIRRIGYAFNRGVRKE
jgi:hypothetical protein